ncbi:KR domain-containing protein, partial [Actinomadura logoneensis]
VVFGSVVGVYGNRGQADYAAANDACDTGGRRSGGEGEPPIPFWLRPVDRDE